MILCNAVCGFVCQKLTMEISLKKQRLILQYYVSFGLEVFLSINFIDLLSPIDAIIICSNFFFFAPKFILNNCKIYFFVSMKNEQKNTSLLVLC